VSAGRDITERKIMEEALRSSELKYKALVENADDAILLSDIAGKTLYKNPAYYRQLGLAEGAEEKFAEIHPEDLYLVKEKHEILLKNGYSKLEYRVKHQNGEWVYRFARSVLLHDNDGRPNAVLSVIRDITEQKMVEKRLQEDQERIALSNEKLRVVGRLTRHDARNKLSAINAYAYLIKKGVKNNPDIVDKLDKMTQSVRDVERIFDFAHVYEKIGSEGLVVVDVGKAVDEATVLFSDSNFQVVNDCVGLTVMADSFLSEMFYNFMDNTRKHGKKAKIIKIYGQKKDGVLNLFYEDDGVGITFENKKNLFKEGFSTGGSTGFGLFLINKMIQVYGWAITEVGIPGEGVKFVISVPPKK
jgi:PAS domain S-box-containing protein